MIYNFVINLWLYKNNTYYIGRIDLIIFKYIDMANYTESDIQKAYIAYFGRPGEPAGLDYWMSVADSVTLLQMYAYFADQREYRSYYDRYLDVNDRITDSAGILDAIYQHLFRRDAESGGKDFWVPLLETGMVTIDNVVMEVLKGAQNMDLVSVTCKLESSINFTAVARNIDYNGYAGDAAAQEANEWLAGIYDTATKETALQQDNLREAIYEVFDNASLPVVSLSPQFPDITEGNTGTQQMTFAVNLSQASTSTVQVGYQTSNGSATAGTDYHATSGTLTFAPGETAKTFVVPIIGETVYEEDESFFVNLVNPTGAVLANNGGDRSIAEIINDDSDVMAVIMPFTPEAWRSGSNTLNLTMQFSSEIEYTGISLVGGGALASSSTMQTIGGLTTLTIAITASPASSSGKINFGFDKANNTVFAIDIEEIRFNGTSYDKIVYTSIDGADLSTYIDQNNDPSYN